MRESNNGSVRGLLVPALLAVLLGAAAAEPPAPLPARLDNRQQMQLDQLHGECDAALREANFERAIQKAEQMATLRERWQGAKHWETVDSRRTWQRYQAMLRLPKTDREELSRSFADMAAAEGLYGQAKYPAAEKLFRQALTVRCRVLGEDHPDTANSQSWLAFDLTAQGKYAEAQPLYEKALAIYRHVHGEDHPQTATTYHNIALNRKMQGKYAEAQPLFEKALDIYRRLLGEDHPFTATSYVNVAGNLLAQGKHAEAQPLLEKALDIRRRVLGEDHPETAQSYDEIAFNLGIRGRYAEAQRLHEKSLAIRRRVLGDDHPDTASSYHGVARDLDSQGKFIEAQPLHETGLAIRRRVLGEDHPYTAASYNNAASNLFAQGKHAEAQPLFENSLRINRKVLGEKHPDTAAGYSSVASNLDAQGKYAEAQPLYEKALDIYRLVFGEEHPNTASSCVNLARNLKLQGKYAEAQPLFEKALAIRRRVLGEDHPHTAASYDHLASNLKAQRKYVEAQPYYETALRIQRRVLGEEHPDTAARYNNVASNLHAQGKYADAQPHYEKALDICRKVLGEDHPHTVRASTNVAMNLWKQHKVGEAVRLLRASLPGHEAARFDRAASGFDRAVAFSNDIPPNALLAAGLARLDQPAEAYRQAEAALARGLLDDLPSSASPKASRSATLRAQLSAVDRDLLRLVGQASLSAEDQAQRKRLVEERRDLLGQLTRVAAENSAQQLLPPEEIQKSLPDDAALILWNDLDSLDDHQACVLRSKGEPIWVHLTGSGEQGAWTDTDLSLAKRVHSLLQQPASPERDLRRLTAALSRQRLEPLRPHLGPHLGLPTVRRLVVLPTGWAGLVPLEVLTEEYRISYVPSGSVFARLHQQHRPVNGSSLLALGDPVFTAPSGRGPDPQALPGTRWEVQTLSRLVPEATTLLGSDASQQRLDELAAAEKLKRFRLLHLATHGVIDWDSPDRSCLLLARDRLPDRQDIRIGKAAITGELTVGAIRKSWHLDADLVVLSACQTALGRGGSGDGLLGFAQAFLKCGARSVVLSRWPASDTATALLMVRFYENLLAPPSRKDLKNPLGRADALTEAKQWLRQLPRQEAQELAARLSAGKLSDTVTRLGIATLNIKEAPKLPQGEHPYAHPFFWATFVLIGDPD
jgi:CHAT domain-containing protein/tetratricopeptide (TPR) repeat protein